MFYEFKEEPIEIKGFDGTQASMKLGIFGKEDLPQLISQFHFDPVTMEEYNQMDRKPNHKMDSYYGYDFGILHAVHKQESFISIKLGVYITKQMLLIICDDKAMKSEILSDMWHINAHTVSLEHMIATLLHTIVNHHTQMLEDMENDLSMIEEAIMENHMSNFNQKTRPLRSNILYLTHYYEQLLDVCEELLQDENDFFQEEHLHHLRIISDRINRLNGNIHILKDYMVQIQDAYSTQVDMNLNHIMYFFTVITTIFMPLTLIVGWYGMNFHNMPELEWKYGYPFVIVLSIAIVVICFWFFKRKKLLK